MPLNCKSVNANTFLCDQCEEEYVIIGAKCVNKK